MNEIQNVCLAVAYSMLVCKDHRSTKCQYVKDPWNEIIVANKVATQKWANDAKAETISFHCYPELS